MTGPMGLLVACLAGLGLGALFVGGLWLTIGALPYSRHPALLFLASFWLRAALVVAGIYLVAGARWQHLAAALLGMLLTRLGLGWQLAHGRPPTVSAKKGGATRWT